MRPACTKPFTVTRFVVSACGEEPRQYESELEAERAARAAARRTGRAGLFKVMGEPATDLWHSPTLIAELGRADDAAA